MTRILSDLKFAFRNLGRARLFTLVAVASLALGIGANTAIFTLLDQLLLRLLPVRDPEQLVMIWTTGPHIGSNRGPHMASYPMYQDFQQKAQAFSSVFCRRETTLSVSFGGRTERIDGELVSGNYFQALGVKAALGRVLTPEEDDRVYKGHPVVVLSYPYWVTRFAADPQVIGQKMTVNDYPMTIVGVSAAGFNGLDPARAPQIRVPIQMKPLMTPGWDEIGDRRSQWVQMFARMKPGYTLESAKASLQPLLMQTLRYEAQLKEMKDVTPFLMKQFFQRKVLMESAGNGFSQTRRNYGTALIVLMCMVGLVLLIACFNVANLLVARAVARQKEIAVRLAVGASRWQLLRQLLIESLVLSVAGGVAGMLLAVAMIRTLLALLPEGDAPLMLHANPDVRVLAFNGALAVLTGLLFGVAPALQSLRLDLWNALKDVVGAVSGTGGSVRLRKILVTAQVAFSFLLLAGAGLFVRTLINLRQTDAGFHDIDRLITFQIDPALNGYSKQRMEDFYGRLLFGVRATPGVKSAAYTIVSVLSGDEWDSTMSVENHQNKDGEDLQAFMNGVSSDYWPTMGLKRIAGRDFNAGDDNEKHKVAIVNQSFATHFFGDRNPLGRHVAFGDHPQEARHRNRRRGPGRALRGAARRRASPGVPAVHPRGLSGGRVLLRPHRDGSGRPLCHHAPQGTGTRPRHAGVRHEDPRQAVGRHAQHRAPDRDALGRLRHTRHDAGRHRTLRRDGIHGGAPDQGDRSAHGAGRSSNYGGVDGAPRDPDPAGRRPGYRSSGSAAVDQVCLYPVVRRETDRPRSRRRGARHPHHGRGRRRVPAGAQSK